MRVPEKSLGLELSPERSVRKHMQKLPNIPVSFLLLWHFALAGGACACFEADYHREQDLRAGQHLASPDASHHYSGVVTASLAHYHAGGDECGHTTSGMAESPTVAKRGKSQVPAVAALSCSAATQLPAPGDVEAPSTARADGCEHYWLICIRSVVMLV